MMNKWANGKRLKASLITILILFSISLLIYSTTFKFILKINHQSTESSYIEKNVQVGDVIIFKWIHSFEHIPWLEYYQITQDGKLQLFKVEVAGFGAGIPENKGDMTIQDGMIIMTNIEENFDYINWIHSNTALESIMINNKIVISGKKLPNHEPIHLEVKERFVK